MRARRAAGFSSRPQRGPFGAAQSPTRKCTVSNLGLRLPIDIPWKRIGVSYHMMDEKLCDKVRPHPMQPSVAVFAYEPGEAEEEGDHEFKVSYLKVTCSVTSFGATNLDRLRNGRFKTGGSTILWPYGGSSSWGSKHVDDFKHDLRLDGADLPCYGALLEIGVGPGSGDWRIDQYPYFSDFDPKKRELYDLVSTTGEIMSRSLEQAGALHGGTTTSSNEVFDKDSFSANLSRSTESPTQGKVKDEGSVGIGGESGARDATGTEFKNVRTADASQEKRETFAYTTQLTQMYQLLSSFHLGTNRAVFFFEPRPHIAQQRATIVDSPRQLEGIQEFFLAVVRPRDMKSICVDVSLETVHLGVTLRTPDPKDFESQGQRELRLGRNGAWEDPGRDKPFNDENVAVFDVPPDKDIDFSRGAEGGWEYAEQTLVGNAKHAVNVDPTFRKITIWGKVQEFHYEEDWYDPSDTDKRDRGYLVIRINVFLKPKEVLPERHEYAILVSTSLCTCQERPRVDKANWPSIVREIKVPQSAYPLGRPMPVEQAENWNKFHKQVVRTSMSAPDRYPRGVVDFWDLDAMRRPLADAVRSRDWSDDAVSRLVADAASTIDDDQTRDYLVRHATDSRGVAAILRPPLRAFTQTSGLDFSRSVAVRRALWDRLTAERMGPGADVETTEH